MRSTSSLIAALLLASCAHAQPLAQPHLAGSQLEAGTVTVSAFAPMRWDEVVNNLRPQFNSANARDLVPGYSVVPITSGDYDSNQSGFSFNAGLNVQNPIASGTQTVHGVTQTDAAGVTTTTSSTTTDSTRTQNAATAPSVSAGDPSTHFSTSLPANGAASADAIDPILRARAATALHQEFTLLDHYLDQAYDSCLYDAWLVRVRVVLSPTARNQPYDVYARLSLGRQVNNNWEHDQIRVVPLLVTDNFERSDTRRYQQIIDQLQASVSGGSGIFGAGLGANYYLNQLNALLGAQYNNLMSVAQENDNTLTIRFGAAFSPRSQYEMQARSFDVTFLLLTNKDYHPDTDIIQSGLNALHANASLSALLGSDSAYINLMAHRTSDTQYTDEHGTLASDARAFRQMVSTRIAASFAASEQPSARAPLYDADRQVRDLSTSATRRLVGADQISVFATSEFRHAGTGVRLSPLPRSILGNPNIGNLGVELRTFLMANRPSSFTAPQWTQQVNTWMNRVSAISTMTQSDVDDLVFQIENAVTLRRDLENSLWQIESAVDGQMSTLDLSPRRFIFPPEQAGVFTDSADAGLVVHLAGAVGLTAPQLTATLTTSSSDTDHQLVATNIQTLSTGEVVLTFPSARALGLDPTSGHYSVTLRQRGEKEQCRPTSISGGSERYEQSYALLLNRSASRPALTNASFKVTLTDDGIVSLPANASTATVRVAIGAIDGHTINPLITHYSISLNAGRVEGFRNAAVAGSAVQTPSADALSRNAIGSVTTGVYDVSLSNLRVGQHATITVTGLDRDDHAVAQEVVTGEVSIAAATPPAAH